MRRRALAALAGLTLLGACFSSDPETPPAVPPSPSDACEASQLQGLVGHDKAVLNVSKLDKPVRMIGPAMAVTDDYRPDRVNVEYDAKGVITRISCY